VNTWHAGEPELADYLAGRSSRPVAASIEAHLLACGDCRATLASVADHRSREDAWARLADTVDRPSSRWLHGHRVVAASVATPAMLRAALAAVVLVGLVPLLTATAVGDAGLVTLLVLAPLAPMAAVAVAYREWADPAGEISLATASAGLRLVATRALAVSLVALPVAVVALLAVDLWVEAVPLRLAVAWCLPGLALASLVLLAGTTRLDPMPVALGISAAWTVLVVAVVTVRRTLRPEMFVDLLGSPTTQAVALAVAAAALLLTAARRDAVAYRRIA
jgi:hypothetical protein